MEYLLDLKELRLDARATATTDSFSLPHAMREMDRYSSMVPTRNSSEGA